MLTNDKLIDTVKEPLGLSDDALLFHINGGKINHSYLLEDGTKRYLVKEFVQNDSLAIDRQERFHFQVRLAKRGLAPRPIYLSAENTIYVEEWVEQYKTQLPLFFDEMHIDRLAFVLARIHVCKLNTPLMNLPESWYTYLATASHVADNMQARANDAEQDWAEHIAKYQHEFVLCHNDLVWEHITSPKGVLLDWEYAGTGDRYFDLLSCAKINSLDHLQKEVLMNSYAKHAGIPVERVYAGCNLQIEFVELTYQLWCDATGVR